MIKLGIKKIEYRSGDTDTWKELKIVSLSAQLSEDRRESDAGKYSTVKITADIRNSSRNNDIILEYLSNWFYSYKITDMNNKTYIFGDNDFRAKFTFERGIGGLKANGYSISIEWQSPEGLRAN